MEMQRNQIKKILIFCGGHRSCRRSANRGVIILPLLSNTRRISFKMKFNYTCHDDECEHEFEVRLYAAQPDRGMHGTYEDAEQGHGAYTEPEECPKCGREVDVEEVEDKFL